MTKPNRQKKGCRDVFNAFLVTAAYYAGLFEFPIIEPCDSVPNRLVAFSKAISSKNHNQWVYFYEHDCEFERMWRDPKRYLPILRRFDGVILPDFSLYRDMPFVMQLWNIYRSRAIGCWLQANGIKVIANMRWGDRRTYRCCCEGAPEHCTIALGSHGTLRDPEDRRHFCAGLAVVVRRLQPTTIVVYGSASDDIFAKYRDMGIEVVQFDPDIARAHEGER